MAINNQEKCVSLAEKLASIGIEYREDPPEDVEASSGFIVLAGPAERVIDIVRGLAVSTLDAKKDPYRIRNFGVTIPKFIATLRRPLNMDADIFDRTGEKRMVRIVSDGKSESGKLEVSFGGGGNSTSYKDMQSAIEKASLASIDKFSNQQDS
jgi:hypothetical protein